MEGPKAYKDLDGREMGRQVFKKEAPSSLGSGKWSVKSRGYHPDLSTILPLLAKKSTSSTEFSKVKVKKFPFTFEGKKGEVEK